MEEYKGLIIDGILTILFVAVYYGIWNNKELLGLLYIVVILIAFPIFLLYVRRFLNKIISKFKAPGEVEGLEKDV